MFLVSDCKLIIIYYLLPCFVTRRTLKAFDCWIKKGYKGTDYIIPSELLVMVNVIVDFKNQVVSTMMMMVMMMMMTTTMMIMMMMVTTTTTMMMTTMMVVMMMTTTAMMMMMTKHFQVSSFN